MNETVMVRQLIRFSMALSRAGFPLTPLVGERIFKLFRMFFVNEQRFQQFPVHLHRETARQQRLA